MGVLPSAALVAAMLHFASAVSGLPIPPDMPPPEITLASRVGSVSLRPEPDSFAGATNYATGAISLYAGWSGTPEDVCLLAHELTHWLQRAHRVPEGCMRLEPSAYRTTAACFRAYRLPPDEVAWADEAALRPMCTPGER